MIKRCVALLLLTVILDARIALGDDDYSYQLVLPSGWTMHDSNKEICYINVDDEDSSNAVCSNSNTLYIVDPNKVQMTIYVTLTENSLSFTYEGNKPPIDNVAVRPYETTVCEQGDLYMNKSSTINYTKSGVCQIVATDVSTFTYIFSDSNPDNCAEGTQCVLNAGEENNYNVTVDSDSKSFTIKYEHKSYLATFTSNDLPCPTVAEDYCTVVDPDGVNSCQFYNAITDEPCTLTINEPSDFSYTLSSSDGLIKDDKGNAICYDDANKCTLDNTSSETSSTFNYYLCNAGDPFSYQIELNDDDSATVTYPSNNKMSCPSSSNCTSSDDDESSCTFKSSDDTCELTINQKSFDSESLPCDLILTTTMNKTSTDPTFVSGTPCDEDITDFLLDYQNKNVKPTYMSEKGNEAFCGNITTDTSLEKLIDALADNSNKGCQPVGKDTDTVWPSDIPIPCQSDE